MLSSVGAIEQGIHPPTVQVSRSWPQKQHSWLLWAAAVSELYEGELLFWGGGEKRLRAHFDVMRFYWLHNQIENRNLMGILIG